MRRVRTSVRPRSASGPARDPGRLDSAARRSPAAGGRAPRPGAVDLQDHDRRPGMRRAGAGRDLLRRQLAGSPGVRDHACRCRPSRRPGSSTCTASAPPWNQTRNASSCVPVGVRRGRGRPRACAGAGRASPRRVISVPLAAEPGEVLATGRVARRCPRSCSPWRNRSCGAAPGARRAAPAAGGSARCRSAHSCLGVPVHPRQRGSPGSRRCCCRAGCGRSSSPAVIIGTPAASISVAIRLLGLPASQRDDHRVVGLALDAAVPGPVVVGAVAVGLAVAPLCLTS